MAKRYSFEVCLIIFLIENDMKLDKNKLIQKLNEYKHRLEQLERYMDSTKVTNNSSLYINEDSPYQKRRDLFDSNFEKTEQDKWIEKAQVTFLYLCKQEEHASNKRMRGFYSFLLTKVN